MHWSRCCSDTCDCGTEVLFRHLCTCESSCCFDSWTVTVLDCCSDSPGLRADSRCFDGWLRVQVRCCSDTVPISPQVLLRHLWACSVDRCCFDTGTLEEVRMDRRLPAGRTDGCGAWDMRLLSESNRRRKVATTCEVWPVRAKPVTVSMTHSVGGCPIIGQTRQPERSGDQRGGAPGYRCDCL